MEKNEGADQKLRGMRGRAVAASQRCIRAYAHRGGGGGSGSEVMSVERLGSCLRTERVRDVKYSNNPSIHPSLHPSISHTQQNIGQPVDDSLSSSCIDLFYLSWLI